MSDEFNRRTGASQLGVFVLLFVAGIALAMAITEYVYASDYAKAGMHPPVVHLRAGVVDLRRTPIGRVAENVQPQAGVWGATTVFAAPGLVLVCGALWLFRRKKT